MIIDLPQTEGAPVAFEHQIPKGQIDLDSELVEIESDVTIRGEVEGQVVGAKIAGTVSGSSTVFCTRCLQPVKRALEIDFNADFVRSDDDLMSDEKELDAGDMESSLLDEDSIDLCAFAREQILLDLPAQLFCNDDCKGLCPKCGVNRNLVDCKCEETELDPRWAALRNLK
ncbi:MAG: DUF177 domain-containing protein [Pyrinomonadaceae bacterium]